MRGLICGFALLLFRIVAFSQTVPTGTITAQQSNLWLQAYSTVRLDKHWSVPLEAQVRRAHTGLTWQLFTVRVGLIRDINKNVAVLGGYGYQETWPNGAFPFAAKFSENRIFEQMTVKYPVRTNVIENRVRLEQRWVQRIDSVRHEALADHNYFNRVRYRGGINVPLTRREPAKKGSDAETFLIAYEEVSFNFGRNVLRNTFDQNRLAIGVGHHFSRLIVQGGYLYQYVQKPDGVRFESNHTITLGFTYNFTLR